MNIIFLNSNEYTQIVYFTLITCAENNPKRKIIKIVNIMESGVL